MLVTSYMFAAFHGDVASSDVVLANQAIGGLISHYVHARLLQAAPSPAPGGGWPVQAHIATPVGMCGPGQSRCRGAAANQKAPRQD